MAAPTTGHGKQPVPQANSDDDGSYSYTYTSSHSTPRGAPQPTTVAPTTATTIPPPPSTVPVKTPASTPNKKGDASSPPSAMRSASRPRDGTVVPQATAQQGQPRVVVNLPVHVTGQPEPEFQPGVPAQRPPPPGTTVGASRQLYGNLPRSQAPASTATKGPPQPQRKGASTYLCGCIPVPQFCNFSLDCCGSPSNIRTPDRQRLVLYLFLPFTFFNLLLLILSTALSQLDVAGGGCYTFWGYKENCDTTSYTYRVAILPCTSMKSKLMIGAGLSIISIVLSTIMVGFAWLLCHRLRAVLRKLEKTSKKKGDYQRVATNVDAANAGENAEGGPQRHTPPHYVSYWPRFTVCAVMAIALILELIVWIMVMQMNTSQPCAPAGVKTMTYGVGFGLLVTVWTLEIVMGLAVLVLG